MDTKLFSAKSYQDRVLIVTKKEEELKHLIKVKAEKLCNKLLTEKYHTQLSYLTKEEQDGAVSIPKEIILDKLLQYLNSL